MDTEFVAIVVGSILRLAGASTAVADAIGRLFPLLVTWVKVAIAGGKDPVAELQAMLDSAELQAELAEEAKFGG